jgi:hypothetical protein
MHGRRIDFILVLDWLANSVEGEIGSEFQLIDLKLFNQQVKLSITWIPERCTILEASFRKKISLLSPFSLVSCKKSRSLHVLALISYSRIIAREYRGKH